MASEESLYDEMPMEEYLLHRAPQGDAYQTYSAFEASKAESQDPNDAGAAIWLYLILIFGAAVAYRALPAYWGVHLPLPVFLIPFAVLYVWGVVKRIRGRRSTVAARVKNTP
ncbi:MAG TPA: hypothetical protein VFL13_03070 [Candidatus Baltobacteraceae bacterium]|nr:hypothetical protein [Candidatus Baltobacteraceae bacterium]